MDTYSFLRELADSWVLLCMFAFFVGAATWSFWPSQRKAREDASMIPFRNETQPKTPCAGTCDDCKAKWKGKLDV
jgi:cytochrome c oxidase cbb3-type subunit 4